MLTFWVDNWRSQPAVLSLLLGSLIAFLFGAAVFALLHMVGGVSRSPWSAAVMTAAVMLLTSNWGRISASLDGPRQVAVLVAVAILAVLLIRAKSSSVRSAAFAVLLVVTAVPVAQLVILQAQAGPAAVDGGQAFTLDGDGASPDIYVVVLDGYGRPDVLEADYEVSTESFIGQLEGAGFKIAESATTSYSMTHISIPSFLSMGYPVQEGQSVTISDQRHLYELMQGDNPLVRALKERGYRYVHGASGWAGTDCGDAVDLCLSRGLYDHTLQVLLQRTAIPSVFGQALLHPFTAVALERFDQFQRWDQVIGGAGTRPDFVFLHVIVPHPPLHLMEDCTTNRDPNRSLTVMADMTFSPQLVELRRHAYADQVDCVNRSLQPLIENLPEEAAVVLLSDHGPDSRAQLFVDPDNWTSEASRERMGVFLAVRTPGPCDLPVDVVLPNVMRLVMNCVHGTDFEVLAPARYWAPPEAGEWTDRPVTAIAVP